MTKWEHIVKDLETYNSKHRLMIGAEAAAESMNNITFNAGMPSTEMLRVSPEGFWVRGTKVPADDKEAETVYNAFKQWLVWSEMNRR